MTRKSRKIKLCNSQFYYHKTKEEWRDDFIQQYHGNKPTSAMLYNQSREEGTPSWFTMANMFGISKWYDWLNFCDIVPYIGKKAPARSRAKSAPLTLTREINIPGDPAFSRFLEQHLETDTEEAGSVYKADFQ